ncbi:hypothetical protein DA69_04535 [Brevundimonas naejangsanensis]|uniref:Peptidase S9 prolyl oligopeptidase catalytic domain-containing protein n=1 Tax=Brevundimonas naejangsanensis TaxID=588932 RepID=A0A172Y4D4_9CAUL|nr:prolyl oligopeptidase family serine peptidase [Brevundimonas naejangsanensis]ANF54073.1 hypothetical protein DA69_04535 [Brevundimonas naejangsanensis]
MLDRLGRAFGAAAFSFGIVVLVSATSTSAEDHSSGPASRSLKVEDITALEAFGRGAVSPDGRWAVYEKRGAYEATPRFDFAQRSPWAAMDLWLIDLNRPQEPPEQLAPGEGPGLLRGAWSPTGARLLIYRFREGRYDIGIVSMADRSVHWTGLTSELPGAGSAAEWISDDRLALMIRPDGSLPRLMRYFGGSQAAMTAAWARTAEGRTPSRTVIDAQAGTAEAETPEPAQALALLDLAQSRTTLLFEGRISDFAVSPDGKAIALVEGTEQTPIAPGMILQAEEARRQRLRIIDPETALVRTPAPELDLAPHLLRWSPDSSELLVWARRDGADWAAGELMRIGPEGARPVDRSGLATEAGADILRGVRADWLDGAPVLYARAAGGERYDWRRLAPEEPPLAVTAAFAVAPSQIAAVSERALYMFADGGFWAVEADGVRRLTPAETVVKAAVEIDPERTARLRINDAPRRDWAAASNAEGEVLIVGAEGLRRRLGRSAGRDFRWLAVSSEAALMLDRSELVETLRLVSGGEATNLDRVNSALADVVLAKPIPVPHLDARGRPTQSRLFLPTGGRIKGLIVKVYPGSLDGAAWAGPLILTYGTRAEVLAGEGYAVLSPSMPIDEEGANEADFYVRSVDLAVDAALAAFPQLPRDRIAVLGHSFGGYAALVIATRTARYRSYVVSSAITDLFGEWGEFNPASRILPEDGFQMRNQQGWVEVGQGGRKGPPWANIRAYADFSPYLAADRISAPVLLITADKDYIPMSQSERMFSALYRLGGTARLVTYWGEHHALWSPANIRDRYRQVFSWLEKTLNKPAAKVEAAAAEAPTP